MFYFFIIIKQVTKVTWTVLKYSMQIILCVDRVVNVVSISIQEIKFGTTKYQPSVVNSTIFPPCEMDKLVAK